MRFYDTGNTHDSMVHQINFLCTSDDTSFPLADKARNLNIAVESLVGKIVQVDGGWEFDDPNQTDYPRGTGTLVEGQELYSFSSEYLIIKKIEIKEANGLWIEIKPLDENQLGVSTEEYFGQDSSGDPTKGLPEYYAKIGRHIRLFPAPTSANVTLSGGLRVTFQRTIDLITATDTTQQPAIQSPFHGLLCYMVSLPYCEIYQPSRVARYERKIIEGTKDCLDFYAQRGEDERSQVTTKKIQFE